MVKIAAGCYQRGVSGPRATLNRRPRHTVCLSAFSINKYEVTLGQYMKCVRARGCTPPAAYRDEYDRKHCNFKYPGRTKKHPVNCVTWLQAAAFCKWAGRRLPTEAEWEYAALGKGTAKYPWGNQKTDFCRYAVVRDSATRKLGCGRTHTWPVGSRPAGASPFGVMDMVGNIREWTQDCYSSKAYARCTPRCKDPVFPCNPNLRNRTLRGASWVSHQAHADPRWRRGGSQRIWSSSIGFRCAKSGH